MAPWAVLSALTRLLVSSATLATAVGNDEVWMKSSCAVSDLEGQNNKGKSEVTLGGNKVTEACEVMTSWYGVPGKLIEKRDKLKGKR